MQLAGFVTLCNAAFINRKPVYIEICCNMADASLNLKKTCAPNPKP